MPPPAPATTVEQIPPVRASVTLRTTAFVIVTICAMLATVMQALDSTIASAAALYEMARQASIIAYIDDSNLG